MSSDSNLPFSFENICMVVGLDPSYVRRVLHTWRDRTIASDCVRTTGGVGPFC
jgi:hypothetical protein